MDVSSCLKIKVIKMCMNFIIKIEGEIVGTIEEIDISLESEE